MSDTVRTAVVTGASRGIGRAVAIALAGAGYDVAITARTVHEGQNVDGAEGVTTAPLPGSLESTASEIEALGRRAVQVPLDLLDRDALVPAAERVLAELGHVDVLVNNAIYVGPGNLTRFLDTPWEAVEDRLYANVTAQLAFTRPILASMVGRGAGTVIGVTSGAGWSRPPAPPGEGGWGIAYGASKAAFTRFAVHFAVEYGDRGIRAFSLQPGMVVTERVAMSGAALEHIANAGVAPEVIGRVVTRVVEDPSPWPNGSVIEAQDEARAWGWI
ncbi:MAG: SDR family oxidoreductase [Acidimicrobiales bacterium]|jgi:NAD(P)-dependent dehydrogenase (short-subunit alcohol dehydrogenase family)|nr:SDR family oxidoreductase [Acidimicrobiales bacterium]